MDNKFNYIVNIAWRWNFIIVRNRLELLTAGRASARHLCTSTCKRYPRTARGSAVAPGRAIRLPRCRRRGWRCACAVRPSRDTRTLSGRVSKTARAHPRHRRRWRNAFLRTVAVVLKIIYLGISTYIWYILIIYKYIYRRVFRQRGNDVRPHDSPRQKGRVILMGNRKLFTISEAIIISSIAMVET